MSVETTSLNGKRILVTGGTTGIGRATVAQLVQAGARVLTFGRHDQQLQESLENARSAANGDVHGLIADVATRDGVQKVFDAVDETLGGIDILINNAGLSAEGVQDMEDDAWRYAVETNLLGYMACARQAIKRMDGKGGHIVFVGSISADKKSPQTSVYAATKAGVAVYAQTLRKEVQDRKIKVTLVEPGSVGADMQESSAEEQQQKIDRFEMLYAEELADAIYFALTRSERTDVSVLRVEPLIQG
ncbi:MAG: SDR family oxidoreductase [Asticcacaulis sp.]|nr:SDR family oxidoreductase [Asticcacaulis sp.]